MTPERGNRKRGSKSSPTPGTIREYPPISASNNPLLPTAPLPRRGNEKPHPSFRVMSPAWREKNVIALKQRSFETKGEFRETPMPRNISSRNGKIGPRGAALPAEKSPQVIFFKLDPDGLFPLVHPSGVRKDQVAAAVCQFEGKYETRGFRDDFPNRVSES